MSMADVGMKNRKNIKFQSTIKSLFATRSLQLLIIIALILIFSTLSLGSRFANSSNLQAVLISFVSTGLIAIGMMALLISGVFDLSVGSTYAMGMILVAHFMKMLNFSWPLAVVSTLLICGFIGSINGFLIVNMKLNPLIATLAMMGILRGLAIIIGGIGVSGFPDSFKMLGQSAFLGFRIPVWFLLVISIIFIVMFRYLKFFRKYYFVGGNEEAARLCGISVNKVWFSGFIIMGLLAGLAGILYAARLGASTGQAGVGMELNVIAGVVIGGASLNGGKGTILGGLLGTFFMAIVFNVMVISGVSAYWLRIVNGVILILAVYTDVIIEEGYINKLFRRKSH